MALRLTALARKFQLNSDAVRAELVHPVLVWETNAEPKEGEDDHLTFVHGLEGALRGAPEQLTPGGESLVFVLDKHAKTVGRIAQNDVVLSDPSVSRVHAYIQQDAGSRRWMVLDKGSSNGTWLGHLRLQPNQPEPLVDGARVRFGNVDLHFFSPESFLEYLRARVPQDLDEAPPAPEPAPVLARKEAPREPAQTFQVSMSLAELETMLDFYRLAVKALDGQSARGEEDPDVEKARQRSDSANRVLRKLVVASKLAG